MDDLSNAESNSPVAVNELPIEAPPSMASAAKPPVVVAAATPASDDGLGASVKEAFGLITGVAALVYVFGFIVINSYLSKHGVIAFSAVSTEYVAAGLCFGLFYVVAAIPVQANSEQFYTQIRRSAHQALEAKLKEFDSKVSEA
jgi:hypothetical protein